MQYQVHHRHRRLSLGNLPVPKQIKGAFSYGSYSLLMNPDTEQNVVGEHYYDPFGRKLWKEVAGVRTYFLYASEGLIAEFDESGTETRSYGYLPGSPWSTNPLYRK